MVSHYLFFSLPSHCKVHVNRRYNWLCWKYDSNFFQCFLMLVCVIVAEIVFKDPSATSTKKTTKAKPVSEKSSSLPEALNTNTQSESPKSSHQGRTAPPKTFPKIKVWIMSIDLAIKVAVLMKEPFPFSLFLFYVCPFFPQLLCIFSCYISVFVQVFLIVSFIICIVDLHTGILSLQILCEGLNFSNT